MANSVPTPSVLPVLEQAAHWFDRVSSSALAGHELAEFDDWRTNPIHQLAFAEIEATYAGAKAGAESTEMLALRHEALSRLVMPRANSRRRFALVGAVAASILAIAGTWAFVDRTGFTPTVSQIAGINLPASGPVEAVASAPIVYRTAIGERLMVTLPDGSSATLNTASRLELAYTSAARRLILDQGQALFRVAKGQARPFIVQALNRIVTAHGTVFDVRIEAGKKVKVALVEGAVSVANVAGPAQSKTELQPNDVLVASADQVQVSRVPQIDKEVSWRQGFIIFEDESLADATAEVNRYVNTPIVLKDDRLKQIRVSGAFRTGETAAFVEALQFSFPVRVVERDKDRIVLAYRA